MAAWKTILWIPKLWDVLSDSCLFGDLLLAERECTGTTKSLLLHVVGMTRKDSGGIKPLTRLEHFTDSYM
jgi:hypothetical protein